MELCYRRVSYKSQIIVFQGHLANLAIASKYRGRESAIAPSINLAHQNHLQLKYRGVNYSKGWGKSCQKNIPQLQVIGDVALISA